MKLLRVGEIGQERPVPRGPRSAGTRLRLPAGAPRGPVRRWRWRRFLSTWPRRADLLRSRAPRPRRRLRSNVAEQEPGAPPDRRRRHRRGSGGGTSSPVSTALSPSAALRFSTKSICGSLRNSCRSQPPSRRQQGASVRSGSCSPDRRGRAPHRALPRRFPVARPGRDRASRRRR
jgi:hypothetical protein